MSSKSRSTFRNILFPIFLTLLIILGIAGGIYLAFALKENNSNLGVNLIKYGRFGLKNFFLYIVIAFLIAFLTRKVGGGLALSFSVLGYFLSFIIAFFILLYKDNHAIIASSLMVLIWGTATILIPAFISFILAAIAFDWDLSTRDDEEIHEETDLFGRKIYKNKTGQIIATSEKDFFGDDVIKNVKGEKIAVTRKDITGHQNYLNNDCQTIAHEETSILSNNKKIVNHENFQELYEVEKNLTGTKIKKK